MKPTIYSFLIVFIFSFNTVLFSQHGSSSDIKPPNVNPQNMARIIMYDYEEVIKKLKIKKAPLKTVVMQAVAKHNNKINEIKTFNYETFDNVSKFLTKKRNEATLNRDFSTMRESQMQANEMLAPLREKILLQKNTLNATFEKELSKKQYKTWIKYQKGELKKLNPKAPQNQQNESGQQSQRSGRQQQGMRRSRY